MSRIAPQNSERRRPWIIVLGLFCCAVTTMAQTISKAEYFFDTDPGPGNGTPIAFTAGDPVTFTTTINTGTLPAGYHFLFIRTRTSNGIWSLYEPKEFIINGGISKAEYFFDTDPGVGNGIALPVTPGSSTITPTVSTAGLSDGEHYMFVRTLHDGHQWSLSQPRLFYIRARIITAEYFIDTDPGFGNGTPITIPSPTDLISLTATIPTGTLADGAHYLFVRTKEILGHWSLYEPQLFTVDSALPIELVQFSATLTSENSVQLNWKTLTEVNNDFFTVQHSLDGTEFSDLFEIPAVGNSVTEQKYQRTHLNPPVGPNYYRLKQTDRNKQSTHSRIIKVDVVNEVGAVVYPNPAAGDWFIDFTRSTDKTTRRIELIDLTGRSLIDVMDSDNALLRFSRDGYPGGVYLLKITNDQGIVSVQKIVFL